MRWVVWAGLALGLLSCRTGASGDGPGGDAKDATRGSQAETPFQHRAEALARELLIVDGHVDLPYRLRESAGPDGAVTEDVSQRTEKGDFDFPRAREGGLDAPFMSIYVPATFQAEPGRSRAVADGLIDMVEELVARSPDKFGIARSPEDVERLVAAGRIAFPLGIENGSALEDDLDLINHFHARGVRYITLTHAKDNRICDSSYDDKRTHGGLSAFGEAVLRRMNDVGIMVDVSHLSDDAIVRVLELTDVPVIASHSSARHFTPGFERNLSDELVRAVAAKGGVVMVNFGSSFVSEESRQHFDVRRKALRAFMEKEGLDRDHARSRAFLEEYDRKTPMLLATVQDVADHFDHIVKLVGIDHVGFGSDFDGVGPTMPHGLRDVSAYPNLIRVLLQRGYTREDLERIASGNIFRVWRAVEAHAASPRAESSPRAPRTTSGTLSTSAPE